MEQFKVDQKLLDFMAGLKEKGSQLFFEEVVDVVNLIKDELLYQYVDRLITQVESILETDPSLSEQQILETVAKNVVEFLEAEAASIRIYDPIRQEMVSYGAYPPIAEGREETIPFEDTIAGEVVKTRQSYLVPSILKEEKYKNKEKVQSQGIHSMLAVPISIPRFSIKDVDTEGVIQIYYKEEDKEFTPLETKIAEMLARRVSYVVARKRIIDLHKLNVTKNKIVEQIFLKLGKREGVKMKDVFNLIIPELLDFMPIQRVSLFSVMEDRQHVILEAGYPGVHHGIGSVFSIREPYIDAIVNQPGPFGEFQNEKVYPAYILITNPQASRLLPPDLKRFLDTQQINSVLYVPLKVDDAVKYFLVFDAQAREKRFAEEEIEIFTFFGKELMKGLRLERMDDILHDFKNPAIAVAGFARRVKKILEDGEVAVKKEKVNQALNILLKETARIQELALTLYGTGKEERVDLAERLRDRFLINEEAVKELKQGAICLTDGGHEGPLWIRCFPLHLERILDNLLNNASNAVLEKGGKLSIRSYGRDDWGVAEISNTGQIPEEDVDRFLQGESKGRGIHITTRLIKRMGGKMELESKSGWTTFRVMFPLVGLKSPSPV